MVSTLGIAIDPTHALGSRLDGPGLTEGEFAAWLEKARRAVDRLATRTAEGGSGFFDPTLLVDAAAAAELPATPRFDDLLVLGIGGSSLGARAAVDALAGDGSVSVHFPDNIDPHRLSRALDRCVPARTRVAVVSKSGTTLETAAQLEVVLAWLGDALGDTASAHVVVVTDPSEGPLRALATERGFETRSIPPNVGGRYSVLTAAGLVPMRLAGLDTDALIQGALAAHSACSRADDPLANPAATLAALAVGHVRERSHATHVLMPYADAMRTFAQWWVQLWGESLGKRVDRSGRIVEAGPTPIGAVGSTDQHSLCQLLVEGPRDKLVTFVRVERPTRRDLVVPARASAAHLRGLTLHEILLAEHEGTVTALAEAGRPSLTVRVDTLDAPTLGALFLTFEAATAIAGDLLGVNPFDQPGVEAGKAHALRTLAARSRTRTDSPEEG